MSKSLHAFVAAILICASAAFGADMNWRKMTDPTVAEVAGNFRNPPAEYCNTVAWGWNGPMSEEVIARDLNTLHNRGFRIATIEAGYRMDNAPYLSDDWFKLIRFACETAKKLDMRLVIIDEGKYPSGFVNGKYTRERPDLRMQALVVAGRDEVAGGATFDKKLEPEVLSAIAFNVETNQAIPLEIKAGEIHWKAPAEGRWQVVNMKHDFRTPQTRAVNDPTGSKTTDNSMGDLISPEATKLFIEWTHEQYKKHVGEFLSNTIIGFRGDEPEMTGVPWTAAIAEEFQTRKGYDVRPYMASFLLDMGGGRGATTAPAIRMTDEQRRVKADYFDVWSELFAKYFFDQQADWCEANGVWATTHLNNDHNMPALVRTTGDFYRAMRKYQAPGVDVIWSQIYPGKAYGDFPKFASSAAHLFGHPRSLSESFAAFYDLVTVEVAQYDCNFQMVRGINLFEFMSMGSSAGRSGRGGPEAITGITNGPATAPAAAGGARNTANGGGGRYMADPAFPAMLAGINRTTYVLSQGRPAAQIAIYMPTMSMWMGDNSGNVSMMKIAQALLENQRDFDFADEQSLSGMMKLNGGEFINAGGQAYRAVIIPSSTAISKATLDRLQTFAKAGGKVIFIGKEPSFSVERTFLKASAPSDLGWAIREPSGDVTPALLAALPKSDVVFDQPHSSVKVMHRRWKDADAYFFFNESEEPQKLTATVQGAGRPQLWDVSTARIENLPGATAGNGTVKLPLEIEKYGAKLIVIGSPAVASAQ